MKNTMYLIKYKVGDCEYEYEKEIFVTESLELAESYCKRFNEILDKWKKIWNDINPYASCNFSRHWAYNRRYSINEVNYSYYDEIEVR